MMEGLWGWDATLADPRWRQVIVDATGHLQVDVLTSDLPAGGATAANQALVIADTGTLITNQGRCYGYDTANWQYLQVESAAVHNLRVRLYGGANAVLVGQSSAALAYTNYGIETFAMLYADDGTNLSRVGMLLAGADGVVNTLNTLGVASMLYGYNGTTWDRLRIDANDYLKVNIAAVDATLSMADSFGGNVYSKTMTMTDNNATRFETASKKLRDVVIIVKTHPMLLGETGVEVYPVGVNEAVGFTKVDISTLYFKNAGAGNNGVITILGVEE